MMMWTIALWFSVGFALEPEQIVALRKQRRADSPPNISAAVYRAALSGEMRHGIEFVPGVESGKGWGVKVFDLPIHAVWKAITDLDQMYRFMPVKTSVALRNKRRNGMIAFQLLELPIVSDRWWCVEQIHNSQLYQSTAGQVWEMFFTDRHKATDCAPERLPAVAKDGMPVAWTRGGWLLVRLDDGRTLGEYHTWTDPGGALPASHASRVAGRKVVDAFRGIAEMARWELTQPDNGFFRPNGEPL